MKKKKKEVILKTIDKKYESIIEIKNSRFISIIYKINSLDDVKKYLDEVKDKYPKATHYCYAYILNNKCKSSDDGEPGGTAGMPILNVLQKNNLNFVLAVVVRYFGGIKLGAGGLVRAYSKSVKFNLNNSNFILLFPSKEVEFSVEYSDSNNIDYLLRNMTILEKKFLDKVYYHAYIDSSLISVLDKYNLNIIGDSFIEKNAGN